MLTRSLPGQGTGFEQVGQAAAGVVAHGDKVAPVLLAHLVDGDHVGALELGSQAGLLAEALDELGIGGHLGVQDLEGHRAALGSVGGTVDRAKAAFAELFVEFVFAELSHAQPPGRVRCVKVYPRSCEATHCNPKYAQIYTRDRFIIGKPRLLHPKVGLIRLTSSLTLMTSKWEQ